MTSVAEGAWLPLQLGTGVLTSPREKKLKQETSSWALFDGAAAGPQPQVQPVGRWISSVLGMLQVPPWRRAVAEAGQCLLEELSLLAPGPCAAAVDACQQGDAAGCRGISEPCLLHLAVVWVLAEEGRQ